MHQPLIFSLDESCLYQGCCSGLSMRTAIVDIGFSGDLGQWKEQQAELFSEFKALTPVDPFAQKMTDEWQKSFLLHPVDAPHLAHWVVALTLAIQHWGRSPVCKGKVLKLTSNSMILAIPWDHASLFKGALSFALKYIPLWLSKERKTSIKVELQSRFEDWLQEVHRGSLLPNTYRFALAAQARGMPVTRQFKQVRIGFGVNSKVMESSFSSDTGAISSRLAKNKLLTNNLLREALVPVPEGGCYADLDKAMERWLPTQTTPLVVKPVDLDKGVGVTTNIKCRADFEQAFARGLEESAVLLVEAHIEGEDHRALVVNGKLLVVAKRIPGGVVGDGVLSVNELLSALNAEPLRGYDARSLLVKIEVDIELKARLKEQDLSLDSIPDAGRFVALRHTANISNGGTAVDVTELVHTDNRIVMERAATLVGLDIAGVDFICPDISKAWHKVGGAVIEVNAQPGFRPHWLSLPDRDINGEVLDLLFKGQPSRVPTAAITGTNGKTTTAKMLHHIWLVAGKNAGVCTTSGVWAGEQLISNKNLSGCPGGQLLLNDPTIEAVVIEMPRKGLIVFGHPTDQYSVAALLNVQNDHIGANGVNSLDEMAQLKSEVLLRANNAVVINAEDVLCVKVAKAMKNKKLILVSKDAEQPFFKKHVQTGGAGVALRGAGADCWLVLMEDSGERRLIAVEDIPSTMGGAAGFNTSNAMFAAALAWAQNIPLKSIRNGLSTFISSPTSNPGRLNFIEGFPFKLLLDFSHNPQTVSCLTEFIRTLSVKGRKHVLVQKIGNRHRSHFAECAADLAATFDTFILGCNGGRVLARGLWGTDKPLEKMLLDCKKELMSKGVLEQAITLEADYERAIHHSISSCKEGDLLVLLSEPNVVLPIIDGYLS